MGARFSTDRRGVWRAGFHRGSVATGQKEATIERIDQATALHRKKDHWPGLGRIWDLTGPPLRPGPEHIEAYADTLADWLHVSRRARVLILGVTPELYHLPWPAGTEVQAADRSDQMIGLVWPGRRDLARREEWTALSLPDASCDVVLLDGGFHLLSHPDGQARLVASVRRVLAPGGSFVLRLFVPPEVREAPETVLAEFQSGRIRNVNALKLRLAMAMQQDASGGVPLADVWVSFHRAVPDPERLAAEFGWPEEHLRGIEVYRDSPHRYSFTSVMEVKLLFEQAGGFSFESLRMPATDLGERCPVVAFRRTP